jgi:uncharacterized protein YqgV (UPF0045/DUF77 family)
MGELTPEMKQAVAEVAELFSLRVSNGVQQAMNAMETRITAQIGEVKSMQTKMLDAQIEQGKSIASINTRLDHGERRFRENQEQHELMEGRIHHAEGVIATIPALEDRVDELEQKSDNQGGTLNRIVGAVAAGGVAGGAGAAIARALGL